MLYAIVNDKGTVETTVEGGLRDALGLARDAGFNVAFDESAQGDEFVQELILDSIQKGNTKANPRPDAELAWRRLGNLRIDDVTSLSVKEAHGILKPYFPIGRTGEVVKSWLDPNKLATSVLLGKNQKLEKAFPFGDATTWGLSLLPASVWSKMMSDRFRDAPSYNFCVGASKECISSCLVYSGKNEADKYNLVAKFSKTNMLMFEPRAFGRMLLRGCESKEKSKATNLVRLNVYSDIPWELVFPELFDLVPNLRIYDYTKVPGRVTPNNYHLTFSYSGSNMVDVEGELRRGRSAAFVFMDSAKHADPNAEKFSPRAAGLPDRFLGYEVVDGDVSDARPFDEMMAKGPPPYIVGLKWKPPSTTGVSTAMARKNFAFVVPVQNIDGRLVGTVNPRNEPDTDPKSDEVPSGATVDVPVGRVGKR